jgi:DNA-binding beta-propeller fold protein YncE
VSLPDSPNELVVLPRAGRSDLVAVVGVGNNTVAFYDDALGQVVGHIGAVGLQPFGIAADLKGPGARLYVSSYQDGRVVVIDVPDLDRPQDGRIVAYLGASQQCILLNTCVDGGTQ